MLRYAAAYHLQQLRGHILEMEGIVIVYHITQHEVWEQAKAAGEYTAPSLESEGFIHASTLEQVVDTANRFYRGQQKLVLLAIETEKTKAEVRFDPVYTHGAEQKFPHIYGPLNLEAVVDVLEFPPQPGGEFSLPDALTRRF